MWRMRGMLRSLCTVTALRLRYLSTAESASTIAVEITSPSWSHTPQRQARPLNSGCVVAWPETLKQFCCNSGCELSDREWFICGGDPCIGQIVNANVAAIIDRTNDFAVRNLPSVAVARHTAFVCELLCGRILVGEGTISVPNDHDSDAKGSSDDEYYSSPFEVFDVTSNQWSKLADRMSSTIRIASPPRVVRQSLRLLSLWKSSPPCMPLRLLPCMLPPPFTSLPPCMPLPLPPLYIPAAMHAAATLTRHTTAAAP